MDRYLVDSPHDAGDCDAIIKEIHAAGYLHDFEWGCHNDHHCGWAIIETDNREPPGRSSPGGSGTRPGS